MKSGAMLLCAPILTAQTGSNPSRWQAQYTQIYTEGMTIGAGSGLLLEQGASIVTNPSLAISGTPSVAVSNFGNLATDPAVIPLAGNTTYIVEFQYRIVNPGADLGILNLWLHPAGVPFNQQLVVQIEAPLRNSAATGTFSAGAQTAGAPSWVLNISATASSSVIVNNITVLRQDAIKTGVAPANWAGLIARPFPRIGRDILGNPDEIAAYPLDGIPSLTYTQAELEKRLAFADVIVGPSMLLQTQTPGFARTMRQLNPNMVLLPYRISEEQVLTMPAPTFSNVDPDYSFLQTVADDWYVQDTKGNYVEETDFPGIRLANISPFCPLVNGQAFHGAMLNWLNSSIFTSGIWDGVYFDNLFGRINPHIVNSSNPSLLDYDWNKNGIRDETPASSSEMTRTGAKQMLQSLQTQTGGLQLVIGNTGSLPELSLAPYVNGYTFEGFDTGWGLPDADGGSVTSAMWRAFLDQYLTMQNTARWPAINVMEGGGGLATPISSGGQVNPTSADLQHHRFAMSSALLGDGFYIYDLVGNLTTPYWYDEYSVDSSGMAVEDLNAKGYLGQALGGASELASPGTLVFSEDFEGPRLPTSFYNSQGASVSQAPGDVISGSGSLVISNPDHTTLSFPSAETVPGAVPFVPGNQYKIVFDWRVLETLDGPLAVDFGDSKGVPVYVTPGVVAGDSGTAVIPVIMPANANWSLRFSFDSGGRIAIDNLRVYQGGIGPWRRDFENGVTLVNPYPQAYTFSVADLAGALNRTGIHHILGTQAPDVNNGQPVTGSLTLNSFDGIILLAGHIAAAPARATPPAIRSVVSASGFGGFSSVSPGSWVEIYGSNLSATTRSWTGADFSGAQAPTSLDGVSVLVGGRPAYVEYVSPAQINVLVASDAAIGPMQVIVSGPTGASSPYLVTIQPTEPGILAPSSFQIGGTQYAVALFADGQTYVLPSGAIPGVSSRPAKPGDFITLYGAGFGPVSPNLLAGIVVSAANSLTNSFQIQIGSTPATIQYAGLAPQATGLYQFNITVPSVPAGSAVALTFSLGGNPGAQALYLAVQN
jgi:uncharacterized protein (TIGR03437 family)